MTTTTDEKTDQSFLTHIGSAFLPVTDFDGAIDWYVDTLGLPLHSRNDEGGYASFDVGETMLVLARSDEIPERDQEPFCFYTENLERAHDEMAARGVDVDAIEDGLNLQYFMFRDPCGNELSVVQYDE